VSEDHSEQIGAIHRELHSHLPSMPALRVKALESLLVEKGLLDPDTVDAWIKVYTEQIGPKRGAEMVARAWTDPAFRNRLLAVQLVPIGGDRDHEDVHSQLVVG